MRNGLWGEEILFEPVHEVVLGGIRGPVLVDGGDEGCLRGGDGIEDGVGGCGRTGVVIVAPGDEYGAGDVAGEVHDVVVCHGSDFLWRHHAVDAVEVRVASCASGLCVCRHVGERGVVGDGVRHLR